jgi:hypothetical protein
MNYQPQVGNTTGGPIRSLYVPSYSYGFGPLPAPGTSNMSGQGINPPGDIPAPPPDNLVQPPPGPPPGRPIPRFPSASVPCYPGGAPAGPAAGSPYNQQQQSTANVNVNFFGTPPINCLGPVPTYGGFRIRRASASLSF